MNAIETTPWGVVTSYWGDVLCGLGFAREKLGERETLPMIYYGWITNMIPFLAAQPWIKEARHVLPIDGQELIDFKFLTWRDHRMEKQARSILTRGTDILPEQIIDTSIRFDVSPIPIAHDLALPSDCTEWAARYLASVPRPCYLLQPFSFNTTAREHHWPYWTDVLNFCCADPSRTFILSGLKWDTSPWANRPNVRDLVNIAPSMAHVFALAQACDGVITTSNSLAHWAVCQRLPCVCVCNQKSSNPDYFFRRVLTAPNMHIYTAWSKPTRITFALYEQFGIWMGK